MKICFLARPTFDVYSTELYKKLLSIDDTIEACFITSDKKETQFVNSKIENAEVYETSSFLRENCNQYTINDLTYYEKKYDCSPIWKYIYTDRFLIYRKYEDVIKITIGLFAFFEKIFANQNVDFYYSESIATLQCYIAYLVGKKCGVTYISQLSARGNLDYLHYFTCDPFQYDINFDNNYAMNKYSIDEIKYSEDYLSKFETSYSKPNNMNYVPSEPKLSLRCLLLPVKYLYNRFQEKLNDPYSYMYYHSYENETNSLKRFFNYQKAKKYFELADINKKYIYFPLHYQPESSTIVCAEKYCNQLFYIDSLAKSLPADTLLYVKDHYAFVGIRDFRFYEELKKYPNVRIISPYIDSRMLIENSYAVTTLTGTAGWEAMLLRKPVILAGKMFYDMAPGIIRIEDIYDNFVSAMGNWIQPSREDIIKYLCACFRSYKKGNTAAQNFLYLLNSNIDDLASSLYFQLNKFKKRI